MWIQCKYCTLLADTSFVKTCVGGELAGIPCNCAIVACATDRTTVAVISFGYWQIGQSTLVLILPEWPPPVQVSVATFYPVTWVWPLTPTPSVVGHETLFTAASRWSVGSGRVLRREGTNDRILINSGRLSSKPCQMERDRPAVWSGLPGHDSLKSGSAWGKMTHDIPLTSLL